MQYNGKEFMKRLKEYAKTESGEEKTNETIAKDINVSPSTVSRWTKTLPKTENLIMLSEKYNCSIDYLLGIKETYNEKDKDLLDILKDIFIHDMRNPNATIEFDTSHDTLIDLSYRYYGVIAFYSDSNNYTIDYHGLIEEYIEMRKAFKYLKTDSQRINMITELINNYKAKEIDLPFKK